MRILWINPAFRDYRVPVYRELDQLVGGQLSVVYSKRRTPPRVISRVEAVLGPRAIGLEKEWVVTIEKRQISLKKAPQDDPDFANSGAMIPLQPGLLGAVLRRRADVIVCEGFFQWTPVGFLKRLIQRTPAVLSYERTAHTERNCQAWRSAYRRASLRLFDAVVCNGRLSKEYVEWLGMPAAQIVTGGMAAESSALGNKAKEVTDEQRDDLRRRLRLSAPVFLYVGRLIELKGVAQLLDGWDRYVNGHDGKGTLLLVGSGNQERYLRQVARDRKLCGVVFAGGVDYDEIASYYAIADVFIMPTLEDNWSLAVPEAMACGLPILCSKYNGCWPELVHPGENGWVFDPLNTADTARHLVLCLQNHARLRDMGRPSREIESSFSPDNAARAVLRACELAVEHRKCRSHHKAI